MWQRAVGQTQAGGCCAHMLAQHSELNQRPALWQTASSPVADGVRGVPFVLSSGSWERLEPPASSCESHMQV